MYYYYAQSTQRAFYVINSYISKCWNRGGLCHGFHLRQERDVNEGSHLPAQKTASPSGIDVYYIRLAR